MSQKEFQRVKVVENAAGGRLSVREASRLQWLSSGTWNGTNAPPSGIHIFVADANGNMPLWTKHSGLNPTGLDYLIDRGKEYYLRRRRDRTPKAGDRVAILGRGIAVVEQVDDKQVPAVLWIRSMLNIGRNQILILGLVLATAICLTPMVWRYGVRLRQELALAALEQELRERRRQGLLPPKGVRQKVIFISEMQISDY